MKSNILVIRLSALGDVCMTIPVIYMFAEQNPDVTVHVLTKSKFVQLFFSCPANVIPISLDDCLSQGLKGLIKAFLQLRRYRFDAVADLHSVLRTYLIGSFFRLIGTKTVCVDKERGKRKQLTANKEKKTAQTSYFVRYGNVFSKLGFKVDLSADSKFLPLVRCERQLNLVGIAPFARYYTKTYPIEYTSELVRKLTASGYKVLLFGGGEKEMTIMHDIIKGLENVEVVSDKLSFREQLELMATLRVMISMDSANMHLASLVSTPVVSIWGGTTVHCGFLGWRQKQEDAMWKGLSCQPCSISGTPQCPLKHFNCMKQLLPEDIFGYIKNRFGIE